MPLEKLWAPRTLKFWSHMRSHCFMPHLTAQPAVAPTSIQLALTAHSYSETHGFVSSAFYFTCRLAHTHTRAFPLYLLNWLGVMCVCFVFAFNGLSHIYFCVRACVRAKHIHIRWIFVNNMLDLNYSFLFECKRNTKYIRTSTAKNDQPKWVEIKSFSFFNDFLLFHEIQCWWCAGWLADRPSPSQQPLSAV